MNNDGELMDMLIGYAASHQHAFNIFVYFLVFALLVAQLAGSA